MMNGIFQIIKEKFLTKQFLSFGIIGAFNTVLTQVLYMGFESLGINVAFASAFADIIGIIVSYFLNMIFTYKERLSLKTFVAFPLSYLPGLTISAFITWLVADIFGGPRKWAKLISLPIYIPINYLFMTFIVKKFSQDNQKEK